MPFGSVVNASHTDPQYVPSEIGVIGTLGTADISGTALTLPFAVDAATGAAWGKEIGTPSVIIAGGTLQSGTTTGTNVNVVTGTQQTLGTVGVVNNLVAGTLLNSGTTTGVGVVTNLTNGSVILQSGTLSTGTLQNLVSGTINALAAGTITTGTVSVTTGTVVGNVASNAVDSGNPVKTAGVYNSTNVVGTSGNRIDTQMTINGFARTDVSTLLAGEDLTNNRINVALVPSFGTPKISTYGTVGTAAIGTLVAAGGVGTGIYVTSWSIDGDSTVLGTAEVCLSFGTAQTGTAVLFRATLATLNDVAAQAYTYPVSGNITNVPLTYLIISGAGTISWNVQYYTF